MNEILHEIGKVYWTNWFQAFAVFDFILGLILGWSWCAIKAQKVIDQEEYQVKALQDACDDLQDHADRSVKYLAKISEVCDHIDGNLLQMPAAIQAIQALIHEFYGTNPEQKL